MNYPDPYNDKKSARDQAIVESFNLKNPDPLAAVTRNNRSQEAIYFPTKLQWLAGQRWERFDLGIVQFGSPLAPFYKVVWVPLPPNAQTVIDGLKKNSLEYRICSNTFKTGDSPTGASAVWADCKGKPMHRLLGAKSIATSAGEKFPGAKVAEIRAKNYCKSLTKNGDSYSYQYLSAVGWTSGQGFAYCWQEISPPVAPASAADPYSVGECWNLDQSKNLTSNYWNGSAPVSCEKSHNAYTYEVWSLTKDIKSLPVRGSTVDNSIRDGCTYQTPLSLPNNRITTVVYYPSPKQWDSSVRTYRCDVGLYQFGSLYFNPKWTQLPSDIKRMLNDITKKSPLYQLCFITSVPDVLPTNDPKAVFANCLGKYSYRYLGAVNLKKKANESYPGGGVLSDEGSSACRALAPKNGSTSFQEIDKRMWESGNTWVYCWQVS